MLEDLKHARRTLHGGGQVVVLNTGALIGPESEAMLQALHSRSTGGIDAHLLKLAKSGAENFMKVFYVGYGHKSIGDCGSTTIFVEGVSMLVAKAIQQNPLYSGQESSTRYVDFANQRFVNPLGTNTANQILERWRAFYLAGVEHMREVLQARHPRQEGEEEKVWQKAVNARVFDIMRGFLPAGSSTNLAWHTNLRQAADHLALLRLHPLQEVRETALAIEDALCEQFPSSFEKKRYEETDRYNEGWLKQSYYFNEPTEPGVRLERNNIDAGQLVLHAETLKSRPLKTELPKLLAECGTMQFCFPLDFGSFRDIQRHRAVTQRMPLVGPDLGFAPWYLEQLDETTRSSAETLVAEQLRAIEALSGLTPEIRQYYLPMGMSVSCRLTGDLPALVYLVERRARLDVHPTLREVAQQMGQIMLQELGSLGLRLDMETAGDRFHYARGKQDIVERPLPA